MITLFFMIWLIWLLSSILFVIIAFIRQEKNIIEIGHNTCGNPYSDHELGSALIIAILGCFNFIVFPLWYYYKQREAIMDKMIEELKS